MTEKTEETEEYSEKVLALAAHLQCEPDEIDEPNDDTSSFSFGTQEYLVLTDIEADQAWDASLESYIDDCILPEIPEAYRNYFDHEAWKRDAKFDGRGHSLSGYDGEEREQEIDGEYYYIYRVN